MQKNLFWKGKRICIKINERRRKWENVTSHMSVSVGKFQDSSDSRQNAKYKFGDLENLKQPLLEQSNPKLVLSPMFSNGICSWASENNQAFQLDIVISVTSEKKVTVPLWH
ncbi:UNVERIFIED_CONTAM: hypothetical protein K2H54_055669 [Gekko kuhli]